MNELKTLEEARKYRYHAWVGEPKGRKYKEGKCAYEVWDSTGWGPYQCSRKWTWCK